MKSVESPPGYRGIMEILSKLDNQGKSVFYQMDESDIIRLINDDYLYWDKIKYKVPKSLQPYLSPEDLWQIIKHSRRLGQKQLRFTSHRFAFTQTDAMYSQLHHFDLHLGGTSGGPDQLDVTEKNRYLMGSIMEEAIASSQIEGAVTSRVVAKDMLRKNRQPRNLSERMIVNNFQTIRHIVSIKDDVLTEEHLLGIHKLITANTLDHPEDAGRLRQHNDIHVVDAIDGDIIHTPPAYTTLPGFIAELCRFFNDDDPDYFIHPIVKASIIHFLIGYFHPFTDGNGRTARALFYWYLLRKGYWLTEYLSISRVIIQSRMQYYRAFQYVEADENDMTYFVLYQVKTLRKAYDELLAYIHRKTLEKKQLASLQRMEGISDRQAMIIRLIRENPDYYFTVKEIENRFGISNQTARTDLQQLVDRGFLAKVMANRKEQRFIKGDQLDRLAP